MEDYKNARKQAMMEVMQRLEAAEASKLEDPDKVAAHAEAILSFTTTVEAAATTAKLVLPLDAEGFSTRLTELQAELQAAQVAAEEKKKQACKHTLVAPVVRTVASLLCYPTGGQQCRCQSHCKQPMGVMVWWHQQGNLLLALFWASGCKPYIYATSAMILL